MTERPMTRYAAKTIRALYDAAGNPEPGRCIALGDACSLLSVKNGFWAVEYETPSGKRMSFLKDAGGLASYYNQNDWADVPYPAPGFAAATVKSGGCGACCASMVVETLTRQPFAPPEAAAFALQTGARVFGGTDLRLLGKALAARFGLFYLATGELDALLRHVASGRPAVANVGGNREGHRGLLSEGGHYVTVFAAEDGFLTVGDPGYFPGKYGADFPHRQSAVTPAGALLRISPSDLAADCEKRSPRYHLFG